MQIIKKCFKLSQIDANCHRMMQIIKKQTQLVLYSVLSVSTGRSSSPKSNHRPTTPIHCQAHLGGASPPPSRVHVPAYPLAHGLVGRLVGWSVGWSVGFEWGLLRADSCVVQIGNAWTDTRVDNAGLVDWWWQRAIISTHTYKGLYENVRGEG